MAVMLYKDGEVARVELGQVRNHLDSGWSYDDPAKPKQEPEQSEQPALSIPEDATNDEIRAVAKAAGIENWETARISTLKAVLNDQKD